jgi:hypothetical protein
MNFLEIFCKEKGLLWQKVNDMKFFFTVKKRIFSAKKNGLLWQKANDRIFYDKEEVKNFKYVLDWF